MSIEDLKKARIITALVTPFKEDGSINFEALPKLIEHLLAHHTEGLIIAGTTGESPTLTHEEELELFAEVQKIVKGRVPLIAGIGTNDTRDSIEFAREVDKFGGFAAGLAVTPYYNKPTQEGLYQHYKAIAEASNLPVIVYNVPSRTVAGLTVETSLRLAQLPNIIAIKDCTGIDALTHLVENAPQDFLIYTGEDGQAFHAKAIGAQAGVDEVIAGVLPDGKESVIRSLKEQGRVAMVGDGINDAPALTRADIGIAIGAGTDVAIDAADVVLMKSRLSDVSAAVRLSRATLRNIHENLFWAFFYNVIGIPLAAGVWIPVFGWTLNPMFGAAAMSLSSFCVVTNALRLNLFDMHDTKKDKKLKNQVIIEEAVDNSKQDNNNNQNNKEMQTMKKTMKIEGMMCGHCEATVKKALEGLEGVASAEVSHEAGTAVVELSADVADDILKKTVEDKDYKVTAIN